MAEKLRRISSAYGDLYRIDDDLALRKAKLEIPDYKECKRLMPMLGQPGAYASTFFKKAAAFFERHGYEVKIADEGYMIMI